MYKSVCTKPWFKPMVFCMQTHAHKPMVFQPMVCACYKHVETYKSLQLGLCKGGSRCKIIINIILILIINLFLEYTYFLLSQLQHDFLDAYVDILVLSKFSLIQDPGGPARVAHARAYLRDKAPNVELSSQHSPSSCSSRSLFRLLLASHLARSPRHVRLHAPRPFRSICLIV